MSGWRTTSGRCIDRSRPLRFVWEGRTFHGFAGDTLASALLANGVSIVGRSFKYHRPRGLLSAGLEEPNAIVQLEEGAATIPNMKATQIELYDGLIAKPVNASPSARFDLLAIAGVFKRFMPAAFYYKTFMWPTWKLFEPAIRRAAGLGVAPGEPDPDGYEHRFAHTDILVVGSGAAGLEAAVAAARTGKSVMLVEVEPVLGGGLLEGHDTNTLDRMVAELSASANVTILPRTMAFGFYDHGLVALCQRVSDHVPPGKRTGARQRLWKVRCGHVLLATGAFERPLAFAANDLPGVMLASAALTYLTRHGAVAGRRIVVATNNDSAYRTAFALHDAGVVVVAIVDSRPTPIAFQRAASEREIRIVTDSLPLHAIGRRRVRGLNIGLIEPGGARETLTCDTVLVSGGWNPAVHLHSQSGGSLRYDEALRAFVPDRDIQNVRCVGAAAGTFDHASVGPVYDYPDGDSAAHMAWLDLQNDVTVGDVQLAARENFRSIEHLKRYTTLGMASDQGKTSNVAGIQTMAQLLGRPAQAVGTTKFRPPFDPITIGGFAGRSIGRDLMPLARLAAHDVHLSLGATMEPYGHWARPAWYPREGENAEAAIRREVLVVRGSVGLFDASPLGKIEVKGPGAAEFLDRMYVNNVRTLKVGNCRYGLMLTEHGVVYDDGILTRIADNHYLVGTTSGHAGAIAARFEEWLQCEWPDLRVLVEDVATAWAVINLAGPRSRAVLERIGSDIDLSAAAFPQMAYRSGTVGGVPARIQRVSYSGELSFEVAVPSRFGPTLWSEALASGAADGIVPFGVEALMALRLEKGFLHVGSDTDGTTFPQDIGFGAIVAKKAGDFVGRRSIMTPEGLRDDRRELVGIEVADGGGAFVVGSHIVVEVAPRKPSTQGWVTSSIVSPTLGRPIAMALVDQGRRRTGEIVRVWDLGTVRRGRIADMRFFDPAGERLDG